MVKYYLPIIILFFIFQNYKDMNSIHSKGKLRSDLKTKNTFLHNHKTNIDSINSIFSDTSITADEVINDYIDSIGGRFNLISVMDRSTFMTGKAQSLNVNIVVYQKIPDKYYQRIELGNTNQKIIYNGERGFIIIGNETNEIKGIELEKLKYEATIALIANLKAYNIKAKLTGSETILGEEAYEVELNFPSGMKWIQYYSKSSGLKIKEVKKILTPEKKEINQEIFFNDYKTIEGIKYPFHIMQILGPAQFEFFVDSIKINTGLINRNFEVE